MQGCAFALYGLFFNISKLNKAVATMIVALVNVMCLPAAHVKVAVKKVSKAVAGIPQKCMDRMMGPEWVSILVQINTYFWCSERLYVVPV